MKGAPRGREQKGGGGEGGQQQLERVALAGRLTGALFCPPPPAAQPRSTPRTRTQRTAHNASHTQRIARQTNKTQTHHPTPITQTGFWYEYKNIFKLLRDLDLPEWPLTDWTTSGFWSPEGLTTEAPVFSRQPQLPTLVGQFVHTAPLQWSLPLEVC